MRVLVTGAGGLIGGELVARLAAAGHEVTALLHRNRAIIANNGTPVAVATLFGDIRQPGLGLGDNPQFDLIVHAAAVTSFDAPTDVYRAVNVDGTRHVIALAERRLTPLVYVSTAYVCGVCDAIVREGERGDMFSNGYEASKAAAESLVEAAALRGLPTVIARPSIVVGDSATGRLRTFDNIYLMLRLIAERRLRTLPGAMHATLDLVPIDHVAGGIAALVAGFDRARGKTVHLVAAQATALPLLAAAIAAVPGLGQPAFVDPASFDRAALPPAERRWHAVAAPYMSYLLRAPRFDTANAATLVPPCPPTDAAWLGRLLHACLDAGYLSARPGNASPMPAAEC
ncbi:SDR family oxidoreductase [Polymorphobacter fuscus]|nr:SDR family oxidoreductase [Polymorphobacter fuscus]NJC09729.1 nucleoside-diphosphate-sugar epimerase [Polymorphobacter fuscus]